MTRQAKKVKKSDFSDCRFISGGLFTSEGDWTHPKRTIDTNEIIIVTNGSFCIGECEKKYSLHGGDCLLLHAHKEHFGIGNSKDKVSFYWFHFYGNVPKGEFFGSLKDDTSVLMCAKQLLHIYSSGLYPDGTANAMLMVLLAELEVRKSLQDPENAMISKLLEYIRSHSDKNLLVTDIAGHFDYNPDYLSRLLKKNCGMTLKMKITEAKMEKARFMLQTTNKSVSEIAYLLDFDEPNLFIKFFIYHQKCTPRQYRNSFYSEKTNHK